MKTSRATQFIFYTLLILIPAGWMTYKIVHQPQINCEVCISFAGKSKCRKASGPDKSACQQTATDNACAFLSSGMTDSIKCASTDPTRVTFK